MKGEMVERGHLGGYIEGGDEATTYPELWRWLVDELDVSSVIDVGCGDGVAVRAFRDLGCYVLGIDGVAQDERMIVRHDYTQGPVDWRQLPEWSGCNADLVWSCEFVEHVEERYIANFLETFWHGRTLMITHAAPGQPGHHHVNCQPREYWVERIESLGFGYDEHLTEAARSRAALNLSPWNHFARSGLVFRQ